MLFINNDTAKSRRVPPDTKPARPMADLAEIGRIFLKLKRIFVLLFNTLITKHILPRLLQKSWKSRVFSAIHKIACIAGYLSSRYDEY